MPDIEYSGMLILSSHTLLLYNAGLYLGKACQNYEHKVR